MVMHQVKVITIVIVIDLYIATIIAIYEHTHQFHTESPPGICGGIVLEPNGTIRSPGFSVRDYPNNFRCVWRISTDEERRIAISVKDKQFDVEQGTSVYSCNRDWLDIYDGENKQAQRIGSYCGKGMRTLETVQSRGRHLYIEFKTDKQQRRKGFELHYTTFLRGEYIIRHDAISLISIVLLYH